MFSSLLSKSNFIKNNIHKQSPRGSLQKWCFVYCNFIEITLSHGCSTANLIQSCRTPIQKNTYGGLLPNHSKCTYFIFCFYDKQKQIFRGVLLKRCSESMQQIYIRTPMPKCDFNKVAKQLYIFKTPFLKNTSGWLLLDKYKMFIAYFYFS